MSEEREYILQWHPDEDANDFYLRVRLQSLWDEAHFQRMVVTANALLDAMAYDANLIPRWEYAFTEGIEILIGLMRHPGFLAARNQRTMQAEEYDAFIDERVRILENLEARYNAIRFDVSP